jgi:SAM-dependent methyltransferase
MAEEGADLSPVAASHVRIFSRALPMQLQVQEIQRAMAGKVDGQLLSLGLSNPMQLYYLRQEGGDWQHLVSADDCVASARELGAQNVALLSSGALPFGDKTFDVIVVAGGLAGTDDAGALIRECHRVLKRTGRLIVLARNRKRFTLLRALRGMLGIDGVVEYTEKNLFAMLKAGFDVVGMRSHTRFLVELVDLWTQASIARSHAAVGLDRAREASAYGVAAAFYRIAFQLDMFLFLTRGHRWTVVAKRRIWRERQAPVLSDSRTITEAVLSRIDG